MPEITDGLEYLRKRAFIGNRCIALSFDGPWSALENAPEIERETYAADAIADILTALYGPAGVYVEADDHWNPQWNPTAIDQAAALINRALDSWRGDAEDYSVEAS